MCQLCVPKHLVYIWQEQEEEVWGFIGGVPSTPCYYISFFLFVVQTGSSDHNCFTSAHLNVLLKIILMNRYYYLVMLLWPSCLTAPFMSCLMKVLRIHKPKGQTDLWTRLIVTAADLYNEKYIKSNEGRACLPRQQCVVIKWVNIPQWINLDNAPGYVATARPLCSHDKC